MDDPNELDTLASLVDALRELSQAVREPLAVPEAARLSELSDRTLELAHQLPKESTGVGLIAEYYAWRLLRGMEPTAEFLRLQRLFERQVAASDFPRLPLIVT